jgi:uncharacterized protein (DUF362 family)
MYRGKSIVSFLKSKALDRPELKDAIRSSLRGSGFSFKNEKRIVIKPNMCYYWDFSTGYTTDPKFVGALIEVIREKVPNAEISIVEADASAMKCKYAFKLLGFENLARDFGVNLVNLSDDEAESIKVTVNNRDFSFLLPNTIQSADLRINVPKPKYMDQTTITCALKNVFGCNPEPLKYKLHSFLDEAIVAINKIMRFDVCVLDGLIVTGVSTRRLGLVMASRDPVAFDAAAARLMGVEPGRVRHLRLAEEEGLGTRRYIADGFDPQIFQQDFPKKTNVSKFLTKAYKIALKTGILGAEP